MLVGDATTLAS